MDPLSVAASVVGLLAAGGKVTTLLFTVITKCKDSPTLARSILFEVADISAALGHLQDFLGDRTKATSERGNLILLDQLLTTLTGCVTTYSDLQFILTGLNISEDVGTFDRIKWMRQESRLNTLVQRLQSHKSSLTLMLTIIQWYNPKASLFCWDLNLIDGQQIYGRSAKLHTETVHPRGANVREQSRPRRANTWSRA